MIYTSHELFTTLSMQLSPISILSLKKFFLSDLISVPIDAHSLANGLTMKRDVYCLLCIYVYSAIIDVYSVHMYIYIRLTCKFKKHEVKEEQKSEELL